MISAKVRIGKGKGKEFEIPNFSQSAFVGYCSSVIFMGACEIKRKQYRTFLATGVVMKIRKGDNVDLVTIKAGASCINVVASLNHARRMVMSLKRGHICQVYGYCRIHYGEWTDKRTKKKRRGFIHRYYAEGFLDWYLPKSAELRAIGEGDTEELTKNDEEMVELNWEDINMKGE